MCDDTSLLEAIQSDDVGRVQRLLMAPDGDPDRVLYWAAALRRKTDIVELALGHDVNLGLALRWAVEFGHNEMALHLLQKRADAADALAAALKALGNERGDVLNGLDNLVADIPAGQRQKLLTSFGAAALCKLAASEEAWQRMIAVRQRSK